MWCYQCLFFLGKKRDHFVHSGPQGCIVYDDDYEEVFLKRGSH